MSQPGDLLLSRECFVIIFDIRSSTSILESLSAQRYEAKYTDFILTIRDFLNTERQNIQLETYKFMGDGWILFLPENSLPAILPFVSRLVDFCHGEMMKFAHFAEGVKEWGISIGVDRGNIFKLEMHSKDEWVGRPINYAARLQGKAKETLPGAFGMPCFLSSRLVPREIIEQALTMDLEPEQRYLELRNISNGVKSMNTFIDFSHIKRNARIKRRTV